MFSAVRWPRFEARISISKYPNVNSQHSTKVNQYKRARVVVEHASSPWSDGAIWGSTLDHHMPTSKASDSAIPARMPSSSPFGFPPPPPPPPPQGPPIVGESLRVASCECKDCQEQASSKETYLQLKFNAYKEIDPRKDEELTEHQYSIMPSHMFAFVLNDRAYGQ